MGSLYSTGSTSQISISDQLEVVPDLVLSDPGDMRLPLRWVAILNGRLDADLALSSGVHSGEDILKAVMAGANAVMLTSELLRSGPGRTQEVLDEVKALMVKLEYESITQMHGSMSQKSVADPAAFERAYYMKTLTSFDNKL